MKSKFTIKQQIYLRKKIDNKSRKDLNKSILIFDVFLLCGFKNKKRKAAMNVLTESLFLISTDDVGLAIQDYCKKFFKL